MPPGLHGQDVPYTFYNRPSPNDNSSSDLPNASLGLPAVNQSIAEALQKYIVTFTASGAPTSSSSSSSSRNKILPVFFPYWGTDKNNLLDLNNVTGIKVVKDETANGRCAWWQQALAILLEFFLILCSPQFWGIVKRAGEGRWENMKIQHSRFCSS